MALNLKTLGIRSISAVVFVMALLGSVLWNYYSFTIFFFIVALIGLNEFYKIAEKLGAKPYKIAGFISGIIVYLSFINPFFLIYDSELKNKLIYILVLLPFVIFTVALFSKKEFPVKNFLYTIVGLIYAVLPFSLLSELVIIHEQEKNMYEFYPKIILGVIFLIWSNDTFAYLGGSLFGKHKMIERISPGKTWEGTIFGILLTFGISFLIKIYLIKTTGNLWPLLGIIVPILATIGDLVESMLKRQDRKSVV